MKRFEITDTSIQGVKVIQRRVRHDDRGHFARLFCVDELKLAGWTFPIAQINESWTARKGSLRGMHYQKPPHADAKLVTCIRGAVQDVALDIRAGSTTLLRWHAETLSSENGRALLIPAGCAHGFQALTDDAVLLYCHSACYVPSADRAINPFDPRARISWPLSVADLSERDQNIPFLTEDFVGVAF
jgi:dTDP-4-dehydrorhamnose 3,5-epimerase